MIFAFLIYFIIEEIGSVYRSWDGTDRYEGAFYGTGITEIRIPGTVHQIPPKCFGACDSLQTAILEEGVAEIGKDAFWFCDNFAEIHIPASVQAIDDEAFSSCDNLRIVAPSGSFAERYAKEKNIPFTAE